MEVLDVRQITSVEGRVLVHGQDEQSGRNYLMLEGTDAKVYFINYSREMEEARSRGELRTNSFVQLRKVALDGALTLDFNDLGDAERLLTNPRHLGEKARDLLKRGIVPTEDGWGGWLESIRRLCARPLVRSRSGSNGTWLARKSGSGIARSDDDERSTGRATAEG
jgi:hypothetical protein